MHTKYGYTYASFDLHIVEWQVFLRSCHLEDYFCFVFVFLWFVTKKMHCWSCFESMIKIKVKCRFSLSPLVSCWDNRSNMNLCAKSLQVVFEFVSFCIFFFVLALTSACYWSFAFLFDGADLSFPHSTLKRGTLLSLRILWPRRFGSWLNLTSIKLVLHLKLFGHLVVCWKTKIQMFCGPCIYIPNKEKKLLNVYGDTPNNLVF